MSDGLLDSLPSLVAFVRTAEAGGFAAAGRRMGLSASAVGKSVSRLEARLGVRLFHRTTRAITLTDEGLALYERAAAIVEDLAEAEAAVSGGEGEARGRLRVSLPVAFGEYVVAPNLPSFLAAHPEVSVEAQFEDRQVSLIEEGYDLAVRIAPELEDSTLLARTLGPHLFVACATQKYLDGAPPLETPEDLERHACVAFLLSGTRQVARWRFEREGRTVEIAPDARIGFNNNTAMLACTLAGHGIGYLPRYVATESIASGRLKSVLEAWMPENDAIIALMPPGRRQSRKVRAFVDFLGGILAQ